MVEEGLLSKMTTPTNAKEESSAQHSPDVSNIVRANFPLLYQESRAFLEMPPVPVADVPEMPPVSSSNSADGAL